MTKIVTPLRELPLAKRIRRGARIGVGFSVPGIPLYLAAIFGGRFQSSRGTTSDVWLLALLYPIGSMLSAIVGAILVRGWKSRWTASLTAGACALPFLALISLAYDHSGPTAPYGVDWRMTFTCSGMFVVVTLSMYDQLVRRYEATQRRILGARAEGSA